MIDPPTDLIDVLEESRARGFLGPGPVIDHVRHASAFADVIGEPPETFLDLGSGGGVPGLVLAGYWTMSRAILLDGSMKRAAFLREAIDALGCGDRVEVWAERAEDTGQDPERRAIADVIVSRSFGAPPVVVECAAPLLRVGGRLVVSEPPRDPESPQAGRWPAKGVALVGMEVESELPGPPALTVLRQVSACPARYPRRVGIPAKRPLF
jgi:16S rRNA (guanine527-N7)-methyltransferase